MMDVIHQRIPAIVAATIIGMTSVCAAISKESTVESKYVTDAVAALSAKHYDRVIKYTTLAIKINPKNADAHLYRGLSLALLDRCDDAIVDLEESWKLVPNCTNVVVYEQAAHCYVALAKYDKAITALDRSLKLKPTATTWKTKGELYESLNRQKEAFDCFEKALQLDPSDYWTLDNRAALYAKAGKLNDSLKDRTTLVKMRPKEPRAYANRAQLYDKMGRKDLAALDRKRVDELSPSFDYLDTPPPTPIRSQK